MTLSRRELLLGTGTCALGACCSNPIRQTCAPTEKDPRCELFAYDEIHHASATVLRPKNEAELAAMLAGVREGTKVTFRSGGQSLDSQSLNDDTVILLDAEAFLRIDAPQRDAQGFFITTGASASWWKVLEAVAPKGLVPPSLVTAGDATVGGTLSADCLSRMSPFYGKEGEQIRSFRIVLTDGRILTCRRDDTDLVRSALFSAVIGGFGYLGAVTEVTFDLAVARSRPGEQGKNPVVVTRSTRHGPNVDWDLLLRQLHAKTHAGRRDLARRRQRAEAPEWSALSIASSFAGNGMTASLLEQRFADAEGHPLAPSPGGVYDKTSGFTADAEDLLASWPTMVELSLDIGFPQGDFVDELFGWAFFLGNACKRAKEKANAAGHRLSFTQYTFALPAGSAAEPDTRATRRFIELLEARLHDADIRPAVVDFLHIPADRFLLSASRDLPSFAVTMAFASKDVTSTPADVENMIRSLSHDCRTLGGRAHLVKNVLADRADLRAMHGDAAAELRRLKRIFDPRNILRNEFFTRVFEA